MIDYTPLWNTMKNKNVTQYHLLKNNIIDRKTLNRLKHNENVTVLTLEKLCKALACGPEEIVRFVEDNDI